MITQSILQYFLNYDASTGVFVWRNKPNRRITVGGIASCQKRDGHYLVIGLKGKSHLAHRLAWLYEYNEMPDCEIDHINGNKQDNRISNLRTCSSSENKCNRPMSAKNTSGFKGVSFCKRENKFRAYIKKDKKYISLGYFNNAEDAYSAYCAAASCMHGEYAHM